MTVEIIRIATMLVIFAAVFLGATVFLDEYNKRRTHSKAVNERLEMIARGTDREAVVGELIKRRPSDVSNYPEFMQKTILSFQRMIFASGIKASYRTVMIGIALVTLALVFLTLVLMVLAGVTLSFGVIQLGVLFGVALGALVPLLVIQRMAQSRRKKLEAQFPVALDIFVRALKTGHPVVSAIDLLTHEMEDPIGSEFGVVSDEVAYGADIIDALTAMSERWDLEDMRMFVVALGLQSQTGGNLAEVLENISKVIRDRAAMFMKVRSLSSEGRMTGWMLTGLPIFAFASIFLVLPSYYIDVADDDIFIYGSIGLGVMYLIGVYTIRRLVDIKV